MYDFILIVFVALRIIYQCLSTTIDYTRPNVFCKLKLSDLDLVADFSAIPIRNLIIQDIFFNLKDDLLVYMDLVCFRRWKWLQTWTRSFCWFGRYDIDCWWNARSSSCCKWIRDIPLNSKSRFDSFFFMFEPIFHAYLGIVIMILSL